MEKRKSSAEELTRPMRREAVLTELPGFHSMVAMSMLHRVNALWRVPLIVLATALLASVSVFFSLFDGTGRMQHGCARAWGRFILFVCRVRVEVEGLDNLDLKRGYLFMANHLSMFDHWAFLAKLPLQFRFAAKASLFRIPFLGWHLKRSGNISVDRRNPRRTLRDFERAGQKIREGLSLVIYPEGGRTWGETLAPFKRGPFLMAKRAKAPIAPVTFIGAHRRLARGSAVPRPGSMKMIIHRPVEFEEYRQADIARLSARIRKVIAASYQQVAQ